MITYEAETNASIYYKVNYHYTSLSNLEKYNAARNNMHGVKRVLTFCCLVAIVPTFLIICPLYLKHEVFKDTIYSVAESDILEVHHGMSTVFCQAHTLKMNTSFNAFQLNKMPIEDSKVRKHIRLKKSMILPDDTLEYWGFYLMKGATVELKVCSLFEGSRILVVKGERNLRTCGLLQHNQHKYGVGYNPEKSQVKVTFETAAELINEHDIITKEENGQHFTSKEIIPGEDESRFDNAAEQFDEEIQKKHSDVAANYLKKDKNSIQDDYFKASKEEVSHDKANENPESSTDNKVINERQKMRKRRHKSLDKKNHYKRFPLKQRQDADNAESNTFRTKRDTILDRGINHGGNAHNYHPKNESDSISSFENSLLECFEGQILVAKYFAPSKHCNSVKYLEQGGHLSSKHEVSSNGYYYYIFFSDNDDEFNNIHAVFDIFKPTYLYSNISSSKGCINSTHCNFKVQMFSQESVIVEVPTRDGIEYSDEISLLISQCEPRTSVYIIFPILVLIFILGCAFI